MFLNTRIIASLIAILGLAGCAAPNPLAKVQNLAETNLGQAILVNYERPKANQSFDETSNLNHWKLNVNFFSGEVPGKLSSIDVAEEININLQNFKLYCNAKKGEFIGPLPNNIEKLRNEISCKQSHDGKMLFKVINGAFCKKRTPEERSEKFPRYPEMCKIWIDGFEWKTPGDVHELDVEYKLKPRESNNLSIWVKDGYATASSLTLAANAEEAERKRNYQRLTLDSLSISELSGLINQFNSNDPDNLIPKAKEKLAALRAAEHIRLTALVAERLKQQAIEEAALRARKERKNIGDQVCISMESTVKKDTGYIVLGQRHYQTVSGNTRIVGFVERVVDKKIQVRISGINFYGNDGTNESTDSFSNFNGGSTLKINSVIWDSIYSWDGC